MRFLVRDTSRSPPRGRTTPTRRGRRAGSGGGDSPAAGAEMPPVAVSPSPGGDSCPIGPRGCMAIPPGRSRRSGAPRRIPPGPPLPHTTVPAAPTPCRLGPASRDFRAAGVAPASPAMSRTPPRMEVHHGREKAGGSASQQTKGAAMLEPGGTDLAGFPAGTSVAGAALVRGARPPARACASPAKSSLVHFWNGIRVNPWLSVELQRHLLCTRRS